MSVWLIKLPFNPAPIQIFWLYQVDMFINCFGFHLFNNYYYATARTGAIQVFTYS